MVDARLTVQAAADIERITNYIAHHSGSQLPGEAFLDRLEASLAILATQPYLGPNRDDLETGLRYHPFENYLIFYRPVASGIQVIRVLHAARDINAMFH